MQKRKLVLLTTLTILTQLAFTASAYAETGKDVCLSEPDSIHCAYISGLDSGQARYIKFHFPRLHESVVACVNQMMNFSIYNDEASTYVGSNTNTFYICTDELGTQCELIGSDVFTVSQTGNSDYTSEPRLHEINLSAVKNRYPQCSVDSQSVVKSVLTLKNHP